MLDRGCMVWGWNIMNKIRAISALSQQMFNLPLLLHQLILQGLNHLLLQVDLMLLSLMFGRRCLNDLMLMHVLLSQLFILR